MIKNELMNKIKECGQKAINEGVYREFRNELDSKLSELGLTNKVKSSDLSLYATCCVLALNEVLEDKNYGRKLERYNSAFLLRG